MGEIVMDWYQSLISDCKAIITEAIFTSRWALVEGYWKLGKRIREENDNFEGYKIYGKKIVHRVAESLRVSERTLGNKSSVTRVSQKIGIGYRDIYRAIQLYEKYPQLDNAPENKSEKYLIYGYKTVT
jgi:hypothetical protein